MTEIWKDVVGYEGSYMVSSLGNVKSLDRIVGGPRGPRNWKGRMLKKVIDDPAYYKVVLRKDGRSNKGWVHRLVAEAFLPNPDRKEYVNHVDGNKLNNRIDNLEWCTARENNVHAIDEGLKGRKTRQTVLSIDQVLDIRSRFSSGERAIDIAGVYSIDRKTVNNIVYRRTWRSI